jgi:hypothetical protein
VNQVLHLARKQATPPHSRAQDGRIVEQQLVDDLECVGIPADVLGLKSFSELGFEDLRHSMVHHPH